MRKLVVLIAAALLGAASLAQAQGSHYVNGYYRQDGTYVQPHHATNPDGDKTNNWSHRGNVNPYTGKRGDRD